MGRTFFISQQNLFFPPNSNSMINPNFSLTSKFKLTSKILNFSQIRTISQQLLNPKTKIKSPKPKCSSISKDEIEIMKQNWLFSLSNNGLNNSKSEINGDNNSSELKWVIGIDPDSSGALAVLKSDYSGIISAEVFDSPFVKASIGKTIRKRLDARSIVQLVQSFDAPTGTIAYLERSLPFPTDGKHGWWSGGFSYGLWIGILVASGFSVVPVAPSVWKTELGLARGRVNKDESRELATQLFPSLSSMLKRKKDDGRAEALLIAAYGNGYKIKTDMAVKLDQESCETANAIEINETNGSPAV